MPFHYEDQFPVSTDSLSAVLDNYEIDSFDYEVLSGGIENTSIAIRTELGNLVLRVYRREKKTVPEITQEVDFMSYLGANGLPVPELVENSKSSYVTTTHLKDVTWQAILMKKADGHHPTAYSPTLLASMASLQAKMHGLGLSFSSNQQAINQLPELRERWFIHRIDRSKITDNTELEGFLQRAQGFVVAFDEVLPLGYGHFDYDADNILVDSGDTVSTILDFDDLTYAPLIVCLGYTLTDVVSKDRELNSASSYLEIYEQTRRLITAEHKVLRDVMRFRHYVVSALQVLGGNTDKRSVDDMLAVEELLKSFSS